MCEVCAIFGAGEHWSDFARLRDEQFPFADIMHYRKERARRLHLLNDLINPMQLSCEDWDGETLAIYDYAGRMELAPTLNDIWSACEKLTGAAPDPLASNFLSLDANLFNAESISQ